MKKIILLIVALLLFNSNNIFAKNTDKELAIYFNESPIYIPDRDIYIVSEGHLLVSPYIIQQLLPFEVASKGISYHKNTLSFFVPDEDIIVKKRFSINIGEKQFNDFDTIYSIKMSAENKDGRVYVPLKEICEAYGMKINYKKNANKIELYVFYKN